MIDTLVITYLPLLCSDFENCNNAQVIGSGYVSRYKMGEDKRVLLKEVTKLSSLELTFYIPFLLSLHPHMRGSD